MNGTWFAKGWLGCRAQLMQATGCERGERATYLGNLCFSFLRLCLVGGTDTRHWAISSYWALVSIMLGQSLGGGGTSQKNTLGSSSSPGAGGPGVDTQGHGAGSSTSPAAPPPPTALHTPEQSLRLQPQRRGGREGLSSGLPGLGFLGRRSGPSRRQPPPCQLRASQSGSSDPLGGGGA